MKGTDISVPTDIDGNFVISKAKPNQEIEVSYVGYAVNTVRISKLVNEGGG